MKKIVLIILMFLTLPVFAQNYTITPKEKQAEYKAEIEKAIDIEVPKAKEKINKEVQDLKRLYSKIVNNKLNNQSQEYYDMVLTQEIVIPFVLAEVYSQIITITSKYKKVTQEFSTDNYAPLEDEIMPYLNSNNINITKINELKLYISDKNKQIQIYIDKVDQLK